MIYDSKWSVTTEDEDNIERKSENERGGKEREWESWTVKQFSQNPSRLYQDSITAPAGLSKTTSHRDGHTRDRCHPPMHTWTFERYLLPQKGVLTASTNRD